MRNYLYVLRFTDEYIEGVFTTKEEMQNYVKKHPAYGEERFYEKVSVNPKRETNSGGRNRYAIRSEETDGTN